MLYKLISFVSLSLLLTGCAQMLPGLFSAVEDIETQEAITLTVDKEAFQKDTNRPLSKLSFSRFLGSFEPMFDSFFGGCIDIRILPPKKESNIGQNNPKN